MATDGWRNFPEFRPEPYRDLEIRYLNGEVLRNVSVDRDGNWTADANCNLFPPIEGSWRYLPQQNRGRQF